MALFSDTFGYISRNGHSTTSLISLLVVYHLDGKDDNNMFILSCLNSLCSSLCHYLSSSVFISEEGLLSSAVSEKTEPMRSPLPGITGHFLLEGTSGAL